MINHKLSMALLATTVLAGCKIELSIPEGGSVVSSSGLYACSTGEVCTIDVSHEFFEENFTAIPETGYEFISWEKKSGGFCGGTAANCQLSTMSFTPNPDLMAVLNTNTVFTMNPIFAKVGDVPARLESPWHVESLQVANNYAVDGETTQQWVQVMRVEHEKWDAQNAPNTMSSQGMPGNSSSQPSQGVQFPTAGTNGDHTTGDQHTPGDPQVSADHGLSGIPNEHNIRDIQDMLNDPGNGEPHNFRSDADSNVFGRSQWSYQYDYRYVADANNLMCEVVYGTIELQFETDLPQLENIEAKPEQLQHQWQAYQDGVMEHQTGHQELFRKLSVELPEAMNGVGQVTCANLESELDNAAMVASMRIQQMSDDYDVETNHGAFTTPSL